MSLWLKTMIVAASIQLMMPIACPAFCFKEAAEENKLSPDLIQTIAQHESGMKPLLVHWNTNGSYDFGLMGINTVHAKELKRLGIQWSSLADPCTNVKVGTWLLAKCIAKYGYTWEGVGCYNSQTPSKRNEYAQKIYQALKSQSKQRPLHVEPKQPSISEIAIIRPEPQSPWETVIGLESFQ